MSEREEQFKSTEGAFALWAGVFAGPVAWIFDQQMKYYLATYGCSTPGRALLHLVTLASLAVVAGGAVLAWRLWQRAGSGWPDGGGGALARSRFMVVLGLMLCALCALLILAQWLPGLFYSPCQRTI